MYNAGIEEKYMDNEITVISPEGLEIAHCYLQNGSDSVKTAELLNIDITEVDRYLCKREVRGYIDRLFNESGFRNRDKMANVWDAILAQKLEEMDDTGMGSSKDVVEIMERMHKFNMDQLTMQLKILELEKAKEPAVVVNTQNNYGGQNYNSLMEKILAGKDGNK